MLGKYIFYFMGVGLFCRFNNKFNENPALKEMSN